MGTLFCLLLYIHSQNKLDKPCRIMYCECMFPCLSLTSMAGYMQDTRTEGKINDFALLTNQIALDTNRANGNRKVQR